MSNLYTIDVPAPFRPVCLMEPGFPVQVTTTDTFTPLDLAAWCTVWGAKIGRTLTHRREFNSFTQYLVSDRTDAPRIVRTHYPCSTMAVGAVFRIPVEAEPNVQNLRVWVSQQGVKLKRKFSVLHIENEYVIRRKA